MILGSATRVRTVATLATLLLVGCQSAPPYPETAPEAIDAALQDAMDSQPEVTAPPREVRDALLPAIDVDTRGTDVDLAQKFNISVNNAPAREFFMSLVEGTSYNMVVHPDVAGAITLELKSVTIPDVMDITRNVYGYQFERTRYGYQVLPARLRSRVYQVNFLHMRRSGASQTRVSSGQITQSADALSDDEGETTISGSGGSRVASGTRISTEQPETTFWSELETSIQSILAGAPGRSVVVNPQTGVVVVRAMPLELREVEHFLENIEAITQRQVILEAKILEVELLDEYRQGINWAAVFSIDNADIGLGQTGGGSLFESPFQPGNDPFRTGIRGNTGNLDPNAFSAVDAAAVSAFGGVFTLAVAATDFNAFIELIENQGNVNVLSSPRVSTLNNQKAVIKVGSDEFFVTDISSTTVVSGSATTPSTDIELTPFFSGIALDVTPQISDEGDVLLHVHPSVSVVTDQQKSVTISGGTEPQTLELPLAFSTVRESDSIVRARSGQVVVIGGLMKNELADLGSGVPGLGNLPGLGHIFRHKDYATRKTELVILIRPIVAEGGMPWRDVINGAAERIRNMNRYTEKLNERRSLGSITESNEEQ